MLTAAVLCLNPDSTQIHTSQLINLLIEIRLHFVGKGQPRDAAPVVN